MYACLQMQQVGAGLSLASLCMHACNSNSLACVCLQCRVILALPCPLRAQALSATSLFTHDAMNQRPGES